MDLSPNPNRLSILVVDDDRDTAESQAALLALRGYTVRYALSAEDAIRETIRSGPDVVLLDLWMPEINGWKLAGALRELSDSVTLIAVSGCNEPADLQRSHEAGIKYHLVKPVDPARLLAILDRVEQSLVWRSHDADLSEVNGQHVKMWNPTPQLIANAAGGG